MHCVTNTWGEKIFPEQAASNANLTAADGYFFEHLLTKKRLLVFGFGFGLFCSYLVFMVI